jgi:predicted Zn-dependent protease
LLVALALALSVSAQNLPDAKKEAILGAMLAKDLAKRFPPIENPLVLDYIARIGRRLSENASSVSSFTFTLIKDAGFESLHEPGTLPGGYVYVDSGLFLAAENEGEFAGMLAHAMSHLIERHLIRQPIRSDRSQTIPLIFIGGSAGFGVRKAGRPAFPIGFLESARRLELQADEVAVQILSRTGFDPRLLFRYIERRQQDPPNPSLSPLPSREERLAALAQHIQALPPATYSISEVAIQQELKAVR